MCTLGFQGKGYSLSFIENYQKIVEQLAKDPLTQIEVTAGLDSVCQACPRQLNDETCSRQDFIKKLDCAHQDILGIKVNQVISFASAKELIRQRMTLEKFHSACEGCEWKSYGVCESALKRLYQLSSSAPDGS